MSEIPLYAPQQKDWTTNPHDPLKLTLFHSSFRVSP